MAVMTILGHLWNDREIIFFFSEPSARFKLITTERGRVWCFSALRRHGSAAELICGAN